MEKFEEALYALRSVNLRVKRVRLRRLNDIVLLDPRFPEAMGGTAHHHDYAHGLVIHVDEVMQNVLNDGVQPIG